MVEFIDKTSEKAGTPLNRKNMMAVQGFENVETTFPEGTIAVETYSDGTTFTTKSGEGNTILEVFVGEKTITKTTIFNEDGTISEVVS